MNITNRGSALASMLALLVGCTSPAPEPASAEAVERAVTAAERNLGADKNSSGSNAGQQGADDRRAGGQTT